MTLYESEGSERMNPETFPARNAVNSNSPYSQRIGDERTVATPWGFYFADTAMDASADH